MACAYCCSPPAVGSRPGSGPHRITVCLSLLLAVYNLHLGFYQILTPRLGNELILRYYDLARKVILLLLTRVSLAECRLFI